jgi:hypothetical protein
MLHGSSNSASSSSSTTTTTTASSSSLGSWAKRLEIGLGIARGLAHLHHSCLPPLIHYNVKSSTVLLDEGLEPKIVDHGLTGLLLPAMESRYIASKGESSMLGHIAPEFASRGSSTITHKCDVFGFGIILLELVSGRRPVEYGRDGHDVVILCDFVRASLDAASAPRDSSSSSSSSASASAMIKGLIDPRISPPCREQDALSLLKLGLMCTSHVPSSRPSMAEVVRILEFMRDHRPAAAMETSTSTAAAAML